jgi:hypothetical protein
MAAQGTPVSKPRVKSSLCFRELPALRSFIRRRVRRQVELKLSATVAQSNHAFGKCPNVVRTSRRAITGTLRDLLQSDFEAIPRSIRNFLSAR